MKRILFATDGSDASKKAGQMAVSLLEAYPASSLIVLHVIKPLFVGDGVGFTSVTDAQDRFAEEVLQEAHRDFERFGGRVEVLSEFGPPANLICDVADREGVDVIVVGSHGRGAVDRLLLGSVSQGVSHRSHVSVLVVK